MYKISDFAEMTGLQNKGVNFVGRAMLKLGSEKSNNRVVEEFMEKVEQEALMV